MIRIHGGSGSVATVATFSTIILSAYLFAAGVLRASDHDLDDLGGCASSVVSRVLSGNPSNYQGVLATLQPGDLLELEAGDYASGLDLRGVEGTPGSCIVIEGPSQGVARFLGRDCCNTVSLGDSSYLVVRRLELDGQGRLGDGVKAESTAAYAHHITLEDLYIHGHGANQQIVGINTKCPAWNWILRGNVIEAAGTGIYLGDSNGEDEFSAGLIEQNLIVDTVGYNLQIKHQNGRATGLGAPAQAQTVIRHNVFSKAQNASTGGSARPNVLVGHWPLSGPGEDDEYVIYGNFFHQNPSEGLFQGEGNIAFFRNLLVNDFGAAVNIQPHNDVPRSIRVLGNTVVAAGTGLRVAGGDPLFEQRLVANASFASPALSGGVQVSNIADTRSNAGSYLTRPFGTVAGPDRLDLFPLSGALPGGSDGVGELDGLVGGCLDFDALPATGLEAGAYDSGAAGAYWLPALEIKTIPSLFVDGFEAGDTSAWTEVTP